MLTVQGVKTIPVPMVYSLSQLATALWVGIRESDQDSSRKKIADLIPKTNHSL